MEEKREGEEEKEEDHQRLKYEQISYIGVSYWRDLIVWCTKFGCYYLLFNFISSHVLHYQCCNNNLNLIVKMIDWN